MAFLPCPVSTCPIKVAQKTTCFLHHNEIIDVIITFLNYDIKNLIMMEKAPGLLALFYWTCGQGNCIPVQVTLCVNGLSFNVVLTPEEILTSDAVAVTWGYRVLGGAGWIMSVVVCMSTLGALNGSLMTGGRLPFVAARRGHLPEVSEDLYKRSFFYAEKLVSAHISEKNYYYLILINTKSSRFWTAKTKCWKRD